MKTVLVETWNPPGLCRGHAEISIAPAISARRFLKAS
jgi:hypothetical protein